VGHRHNNESGAEVHRSDPRRHHGHMTCEPPDHETASPESSPAEEGPIELLQRWQRFGATWQVIDRTDTCVTISLCRCDGGEEAQRFSSADPELIEWLGARTDSEAQAPWRSGRDC